MRRLPLVPALSLLALAASAGAAPGQPVKPDPDSTRSPLVGAADRARNGPSPLATPPADVGNASDPDDAPPPPPIGNVAAPH